MENEHISSVFTFKTLFTATSRTKRLTKLVSVGFGLILLTWLLSQLEWTETLATLRTVPPSFLVVGFLCYLLSFYLRALRFRMLLPPEHPRNHLFPIVLVHYTALNIIPARLGELSYVYLLSKVNRMPVGISLSSLLLARVFDHLAISVLFLLSLGFVRIASPWFNTIIWFVGGFLLTTLVGLLLLLNYKEQGARWVKRLLHMLRCDRLRLTQRVIREIDAVVDALNNIHLLRTGWKIVGLSIGIWCCIFSVNYFLLRAFQAPLTYMEIILISTCIILLSVLPFQMLSGFGVHETTFVVMAGAFGVARTIAITAAVGSHIVATVYLCLLGFYGLGSLKGVLNSSRRP